MSGINIGTLAAGIGSGLKNMASIYPNMQAQMQNAAYKGAQQRDLDWEHGNRVARYNNTLAYAKKMGFDDNLSELIARADMSNGKNIADAFGAMRQGASMTPFLEIANARKQLATPEGVVQAMANLPKGMTMPQAPDAPAGEPPAGMMPQRASVPQVDRQALENRIAQNSETIRRLASLNAIIEGKNQYGQANQYGFQPNNLIGGGEIVDPEMRTTKMTSERSLARQRDASAYKSRVQAVRTGTGKGRGHGHRRSGGLGIDYREDRRNAVEAYRQASPEGKQQIKAAFRSKWGRNL